MRRWVGGNFNVPLLSLSRISPFSAALGFPFPLRPHSLGSTPAWACLYGAVCRPLAPTKHTCQSRTILPSGGFLGSVYLPSHLVISPLVSLFREKRSDTKVCFRQLGWTLRVKYLPTKALAQCAGLVPQICLLLQQFRCNRLENPLLPTSDHPLTSLPVATFRTIFSAMLGLRAQPTPVSKFSSWSPTHRALPGSSESFHRGERPSNAWSPASARLPHLPLSGLLFRPRGAWAPSGRRSARPRVTLEDAKPGQPWHLLAGSGLAVPEGAG